MRKRHLISKQKREITLVFLSVLLVGFGATALWGSSLKIPDIASLSNRKVEQSTKIYDRTGTVLLDDLSNNVSRTIVPIDQISPYIQ